MLRCARNDVERFEFQIATTPRSRGAMRPKFAFRLAPEIRGRREDRVRAAPAVSQACASKKCAHEHTGSRRASGLPVPWSEAPDFARPHVEWLDGRRVPTDDGLPPVDQFPIPDVLFILPVLNPRRPTGSKAMADAHGARQRLANCRPGAWLISPYSEWRWAKWPDGEVGRLPKDTVLPDCLRVR